MARLDLSCDSDECLSGKHRLEVIVINLKRSCRGDPALPKSAAPSC